MKRILVCEDEDTIRDFVVINLKRAGYDVIDVNCGESALQTFDDENGKKVFWHTASHILAQAVKNLYPDAKLTIGPAIENGFYYDIDSEVSVTPEALGLLEAEMKKIVKENHKIERFELARDEAIALMSEKNEPYKVQLIEELPEGEIISFYRQGEFVDLCAGPHLFSTGAVKAFKLTQCTGAYWKGDQNNKMLQRIYGTAFPTKDELKAYLEMVEEAKKLAAIHKNIVIKIPITEEGLKAVKQLTALGIKTNVTLIFSAAQALLAAKAGATYVSPFVGRLDDISDNGMSIVEDIAAMFDIHGIKTEIIAASIRGPQDVVDAAKCGAHIATIPAKVIMQMIKHPLTDIGIQRFMEDWNSVFNK